MTILAIHYDSTDTDLVLGRVPNVSIRCTEKGQKEQKDSYTTEIDYK